MIYNQGDVTIGGEPEEIALFLALVGRIQAHPEEWDVYHMLLNTMIEKYNKENGADDDD